MTGNWARTVVCCIACAAVWGAAAQVPLATAKATAPAKAPSPALSEHARKDIDRHRAMAAAHEAAAQCLAAGREESQCQAELATACKGLAIGKYCGMRHEH